MFESFTVLKSQRIPNESYITIFRNFDIFCLKISILYLALIINYAISTVHHIIGESTA